MECVVKIKDVYGKPTVYPVNEAAKLLAKLAGTKTLTVEALSVITALGYNVSTVSAWATLEDAICAK